MGLSTLPEVGAGEALGPTKRNRALQTPDATRDIDADEWNAAAVALEGVCAEVGLSNGTTAGSLVARVTALEDAPPGSGDGDVVGPASSTDNAIATFDSTTGKIIQDSGVDIGAIAAAQADATQALSDAAAAQSTADTAASNATTALAAATGAQSVRLITTNASITASDLGKLLLVAVSGSDITLTFGDDVLATHAFTVVRSYTAGTDPGGAVIFAGASGTHNFAGAARLSNSQSMIRMVLAAIDGTTRYWQCEREAAHLYIPIATAHTASTKTLATYESGRHQALDTSSNSIAISIPDTLRPGFVWTGRKSSASNSVTFATGSGLITPTVIGPDPVTANGAVIRIFVESSAVAYVIVTQSSLPVVSGATTGRVAVIGTSGSTITQGTRLAADLVEGPASAVASNLAGFNGTGGKTIQDSGVSAAYAFDAIAPTVQSAHTSATRTLALSDLNQIIPLSAASNAIAVTIPHTLYAAAGSGRAFVCSLTITSVAGGAVTFAGSGGIVIKYHGKKPATTAIVADDTVHVVVSSATRADVYISAVIP